MSNGGCPGVTRTTRIRNPGEHVRSSNGQSSALALSDLAELVRAFVAAEVGVPADELTHDMTLFGDLGVDGDDADELMCAFGARFGVDLSGFDRRSHFGGEGLPPFFLFSWLAGMLRRGTPESRVGVEPISIGDLIEAARVGHWGPDA